MLKELKKAQEEMKKARVYYRAKLQQTLEKTCEKALREVGIMADMLSGFWHAKENFLTYSEIENLSDEEYEAFGKNYEWCNKVIEQQLPNVEIKLYQDFSEIDEYSEFSIRLMSTGEILIEAKIDKIDFEIIFEVKRLK